MFKALAAALIFALPLIPAEPAGKIVRPANNAWFRGGVIDVVATAPSGTLLLDGAAIEAEEPFPNVLHATIEATPGSHEVSLKWAGGEQTARIFIGASAPIGYEKFVSHPAPAIECESCHSLSRRGLFRFSGDCFGCHVKDAFAKVHGHEPHVLESCGRCHNAHGSTTDKHLVMAQELACKQCHN